MIERRKALILIGASLIAAPAIVRAQNIMRVKPIDWHISPDIYWAEYEKAERAFFDEAVSGLDLDASLMRIAKKAQRIMPKDKYAHRLEMRAFARELAA